MKSLPFLLPALCLITHLMPQPGHGSDVQSDQPVQRIQMGDVTLQRQLSCWSEHGGVYHDCDWLSDHELLCQRQSAGIAHPLFPDIQFYRLNVRTGHETPLSGATQNYARYGPYCLPPALSPDGNWLVWRGEKSGVYGCRIDGSGRFELQADAGLEVGWCSAGHTFWTHEIGRTGVREINAHSVRIRTPEHLKSIRTLWFRNGNAFIDLEARVPGISKGGYNISLSLQGHSIHVRTQHRYPTDVLTSGKQRTGTHELSVEEWMLGRHARRTHVWRKRFDHPILVLNYFVTQDQKRIVWELATPSPQAHKSHPVCTLTLSVSDVALTRFRPLYKQSLTPEQVNGSALEYPLKVQPGGHAFSIVVGNTMHVLPL
jgi:hypothetical protein